jgi:hypothetical protein
MKKILFLGFLAFAFSMQLIAQNDQEAPKVKFEKVSEDELKMVTYPNDTTAEAVILYDNGSSYVKYDSNKGFILTHERFVRIKILKKEGVSWGNFTIALYSYGGNEEDLTVLKGTSFNLENGKIVKSELKKDAIFRERQNKFTETVRLALPSVKIGSVIDFKYNIQSALNYQLRPWKFQYPIPVKWSQYTVTYPEYFTYNHSSLGYHPLLYAKTDQKSEVIYPQSGGREKLFYNAYVYDYAAKDVPAIKAEPYLTTLNNYTTQVKFELANTDFTSVGGSVQNFSESWNNIASKLNENEDFGKQLRADGFVSDIVSGLINGITDEQKKLEIIYCHVQQTMKWNGQNSIYTSVNLKKSYSDKIGNSADINLLLAIMLNKASISTYPIILSTRDNGFLSFSHASSLSCNYVIAQATVNGKPVMLDATEPNLRVGFLPMRCLNGSGHLIYKESSQNVAISNTPSIENTVIEIESKDGKMIGTVNKKLSGLNALNFRESVRTAGGKKEYFDKLKNGSTDLDFLEYKYDKLDSINQPAFIKYRISTKESQNDKPEIIYFDPLLFGNKRNNPFTSPTRLYPVDFGAPFVENYNLQLTIPEGYAIEELPQNKTYTLEGKGGVFLYKVSKVGNIILLNIRFSIDKPLFLPSEYLALKEFFNVAINKQAEQIILKKTAI